MAATLSLEKVLEISTSLGISLSGLCAFMHYRSRLHIPSFILITSSSGRRLLPVVRRLELLQLILLGELPALLSPVSLTFMPSSISLSSPDFLGMSSIPSFMIRFARPVCPSVPAPSPVLGFGTDDGDLRG